MYGNAENKPACGNTEPHSWHDHTWMDHHFKEHSAWCEGVCDWCYPFIDSMYVKGPHGPGAHK